MLVLLVLNVSIIAFFFITKPKHAPVGHVNHGFMEEAIDRLDLDEKQEEVFAQSAKRHNMMMKEISAKQKELLKPYFLTISDKGNNVNKDSIIVEIQKLKEKKINETYHHFEEVKTLLKPEQQKYYDEFLLQAIGRIMGAN